MYIYTYFFIFIFKLIFYLYIYKSDLHIFIWASISIYNFIIYNIKYFICNIFKFIILFSFLHFIVKFPLLNLLSVITHII